MPGMRKLLAGSRNHQKKVHMRFFIPRRVAAAICASLVSLTLCFTAKAADAPPVKDVGATSGVGTTSGVGGKSEKSVVNTGAAAVKAAVPPDETKPQASAPRAPKRSRANEDARGCLELPTRTAIIKCAEQFL